MHFGGALDKKYDTVTLFVNTTICIEIIYREVAGTVENFGKLKSVPNTASVLLNCDQISSRSLKMIQLEKRV